MVRTPSLASLMLATPPAVVVQPPPSSWQATLWMPLSCCGSLPVASTVCSPLTHAGAAAAPVNATVGTWVSIFTVPASGVVVE